MSPSSQPPHGQANSVSATLGRAIGPVLVLLFVTVALALLSAPVAGQLAVIPGSAGESGVSTAPDTAGEPVTENGLAPVVGPTNADGDGSAETLITEVRPAGAGFTTEGDGLDDRQMVASHGDEGGTVASAVADGTWYREEAHLTATSPESTATHLEPAELSDSLVAGHVDDDATFGSDAGSSDYHAMSGGANGNLQGERFERPWGLNPSAPVSPATIGGIAFGFLLGAGAFAVARPEGIRNGQSLPEGTDNIAGGSDQVGPTLADDDHVPDEAIVEGILLSQDGRMKQSAIVNMTDWSKAKVSRVLSAMADEGRVVKVRIGRENLICLDGWEPDALKHPHAA